MADVNEMAAKVEAMRQEALGVVEKWARQLEVADEVRNDARANLAAAMAVCADLGMRHSDIAPFARMSESTVSATLRANKPDAAGPAEPTLEESQGPAQDAPASSREMEAPIEPDPEYVDVTD